MGLPVRLTDSIDRGRSLYRGRRGFILNWAERPDCERSDVDGEWVMNELPSVIYVHFPGAHVVITDIAST